MKKTRIIAIIMSIVMAGMTWAPVSTFASAADDSVAVTEDNIEVEDIEEIDDMDFEDESTTEQNEVNEDNGAEMTPTEVLGDDGAIEETPTEEIFREESVGISPRSIIGTDDRVRVTDTTRAPYSRIGMIESTFPNGRIYIGTGWLYGDGVVATAAHNLYDSTRGGKATTVRFYPGMNGSQRPFGTINAVKWEVPSEWIGNGRPVDDYGVVVLEEAIGHQIGWLDIEVDSKIAAGNEVSVSGYPGEDDKLMQQWMDKNSIMDVSSDLMWHYVDTTAGQSGAPVIRDNGKVVAIHTYGEITGTFNVAGLITRRVNQFLQDAKRQIRLGWYKDSEGEWYKTGPEGNDYVKSAWRNISGTWYYFNDKGYLVKNDWVKRDGHTYRANANGAMNTTKNNWLLIDGHYYRFDGNSRRIESRWMRINSTWYWLKADGKMATNEWANDSKGRCWLRADGKMAANTWIQTGGEWYWINASGHMVRNTWIRYKGTWYRLKADGKMAANEWANDSKGRCWLRADGKMVANMWIRTGGEWYWINASGHMVRSRWFKDRGTWYRLKADGKMAANEWANDSKGRCWLRADGKMVANTWIQTGGQWYWINASGHMVKNAWTRHKGAWYWLKGNGTMANDETLTIKGKRYHFDASGKMK